MELYKGKKISEIEKKILQDLFSCIFDLDIKLCSSQDFYKLVHDNLLNTIEVNSDIDLKSLIEKIGHLIINDEDEVFLIDEMPNKIYKFEWGLLKENWEELWSPPSDDMIIIYIPNNNIILITHWDMVYFYNNPKSNKNI